MNLVRCEEGHFYNADKYPACPHCNGSLKSMDENDIFSTPRIEDDIIVPKFEGKAKKKIQNNCIAVSAQQIVKPRAVHADIYRSSAILKLRAAAQLKEGENLIYISDERLSSDLRLKFTEHVDSIRILGKIMVTASEQEGNSEGGETCRDQESII